MTTVAKLPRAHLVTNKIFKALEHLKASGHPGYTDFDTIEQYTDRCKETDLEGYESLFGERYQIDEVLENLNPWILIWLLIMLLMQLMV